MSKLKEQLYILCADYLKNREAEIRKIIAAAREAANNDTKSSAGDKFETGREIMQQEIDLNLARLNDLNQLKQTLDRIIPGQKSQTAQSGSIVRTNNGNYYISISAGALKVDSVTYYAISAASPIGAKLAGRNAGDQFSFNGKTFVVESVV
jgi:transcription elongation GreA/GreB family factor